MNVLQIDSVNVLTRAHYMPAFSRLGPYDLRLLHRAEHPRRQVFEYWAHVASYSLIEHHPLLRHRMSSMRDRQWPRLQAILAEHPTYLDDVRVLVDEHGPVTAAQVEPERRGKRRGEMWGWHHGKVALEWLFWTGELTPVRRNAQFERVLDLTERVIPAAVLALPTPPVADAYRALMEIAARSHGIATARHLKDYYRLRGPLADQALRDLADSGIISEVAVRGSAQRWYLHRDAKRPRAVRRAALLSPFDPVVWERDRTLDLWDCHYRIEIYTPAAQRVHGYYVLLFLLDEQIAARVDLKADRPASTLLVQAAFLEDTTTLPPAYVAEQLAVHLHSLAHWLGLERVTTTGRGSLPLLPV